MSVYHIFFLHFKFNIQYIDNTVLQLVIIASNIASNLTCQCSLTDGAKAQRA